jgi:hypothetical protein
MKRSVIGVCYAEDRESENQTSRFPRLECGPVWGLAEDVHQGFERDKALLVYMLI